MEFPLKFAAGRLAKPDESVSEPQGGLPNSQNFNQTID